MAERGTPSAEHLRDLASQGRTREAAVCFLSAIAELSWTDFEGDEFELLDAFCDHVLGGLLQQDVAWLIRSPTLLSRLTYLIEQAVRAGYRSPSSTERLARLRCLLAMSEATRGRLEQAHEQLVSSAGRTPTEVPCPNGELRENVASLSPPDLTAARFLEGFFGAYFAFLRRIGEHDLANVLEASVRPLTALVLEEERRPGIVRALFCNREEKKGYIRQVHASVTLSDEGEEGMRYLSLGNEQVEPSMSRAADVAWRAVDHYLTGHGYPDGLESRLVRWQLTTAAGDPVETSTRYEGGSIGLPLAMAILSAYLDQPVPCHVAFTGAFDPWATEEGTVDPVDGVPEKVSTAVGAGCRKVYVPVGNAGELSENLALQNRARQASCAIAAVGELKDACSDTFNDERDGTFASTLADAWHELIGVFRRGPETPRPSTFQRYRWHAALSAALFGVLFLFEGLVAQFGLARQKSGPVELTLIGLAALAASAAVLWCYALACAGLRNRKRWPWLASGAVLAVSTGVGVLLLYPVAPTTTDISTAVDAVPLWGVTKDVFFFALFGWALLANTFCAVAALTYLADRGQFLTLRRSLRWQNPLEAGLPLRCLVFPWEWGALAVFIVAIVLGALEIGYFLSFRTDAPEASWAINLLMTRDILFILAAVECFIFYKHGLADARKALA